MGALVEFDPSCEALIFTPLGEPIHGKTRAPSRSALPDSCLPSFSQPSLAVLTAPRMAFLVTRKTVASSTSSRALLSKQATTNASSRFLAMQCLASDSTASAINDPT